MFLKHDHKPTIVFHVRASAS